MYMYTQKYICIERYIRRNDEAQTWQREVLVRTALVGRPVMSRNSQRKKAQKHLKKKRHRHPRQRCWCGRRWWGGLRQLLRQYWYFCASKASELSTSDVRVYCPSFRSVSCLLHFCTSNFCTSKASKLSTSDVGVYCHRFRSVSCLLQQSARR
jgi:hypothetical protein